MHLTFEKHLVSQLITLFFYILLISIMLGFLNYIMYPYNYGYLLVAIALTIVHNTCLC